MARKRKWIDRKLLKELCLAQLTDEEIARCLKVSPDTLTRRYAEPIKAWKKQGVASMRRRLFMLGMREDPVFSKDGDVIGSKPASVPSMIFFLKNFAGMADVTRDESKQKLGYGTLPMPDDDKADVIQ